MNSDKEAVSKGAFGKDWHNNYPTIHRYDNQGLDSRYARIANYY